MNNYLIISKILDNFSSRFEKIYIFIKNVYYRFYVKENIYWFYNDVRILCIVYTFIYQMKGETPGE